MNKRIYKKIDTFLKNYADTPLKHQTGLKRQLWFYKHLQVS